MPCSVMGDMSIEQSNMDMTQPCQMDMKYAQSCANCDISSVAILMLDSQDNSIVQISQSVSPLVIQFTTNNSPPLIRPPIKKSIS